MVTKGILRLVLGLLYWVCKGEKKMTIEAHDKRCNNLFSRLDQLKTEGKDGNTEYMAVLAALRTATKERLVTVGLAPQSLTNYYENHSDADSGL